MNQSATRPEPLTKEFFSDYFQLSKFTLTLNVVMTAVITYLLGWQMREVEFSALTLFGISVGGLLVVASSNAFNQIIERDYDKLMSRTENRPLANGRMTVNDAFVFAIVTAVCGLLTLYFLVNYISALLGLIAIMGYTMAYTPLKRITPLAVFVGAIPGAIPPMIGWVAVSGYIDEIAIVLFIIQFFWQFPHFWAIAWIYHDDYQKAGYLLLPSKSGRSRSNALQTVWYTLVLMITSLYPVSIEFGGWPTVVAVLLAGGYMLYRSVMLTKTLSVQDAKKLMYSSFIYMPVVLFSFML